MFLKEKSSFPPVNMGYDKFTEWGVWYSGESQYLINHYTIETAKKIQDNSLFWAKVEQSERNNMVHIPIAGDVASMSAGLLFSESPRITFENRNGYADILTKFMKENGFDNNLLESAEIASGFGGTLIKIDIDYDLSDFPILSSLTPLQFYPTFKMGRLWSVLMWREVLVDKEKNIYYRLFEDRSRDGKNLLIDFKLFKGSCDNVGVIVDLNSVDEVGFLNLKNITLSNISGLGCVYVPNMKPNKLNPGSPLGINDYNSSITLMDGLDSIWSSWLNDIELGRGQIFIDEELLQREDNNIDESEIGEGSFSKFKRCFIKLNLSNYKMANDNVKPIDVNQFAIRTEDHLKACVEAVKTIVGNCGYSPQSFGMDINGQAESGTALKTKHRKSTLTTQKKSRYYQPQINYLLRQVVAMYYATKNKNTRVEDPDEISVTMEDSIPTDAREMSETIRNLEMAKAISTYMKVKMQYPDWSEDEINVEVDRINKESGADLDVGNFDLTNYSKKPAINENSENEDEKDDIKEEK